MRNGRRGASRGHIIKPVTNVELNASGKHRDPVAGRYLKVIPPEVQGICSIHPSTPISPCLRAAHEVGKRINSQAPVMCHRDRQSGPQRPTKNYQMKEHRCLQLEVRLVCAKVERARE